MEVFLLSDRIKSMNSDRVVCSAVLTYHTRNAEPEKISDEEVLAAVLDAAPGVIGCAGLENAEIVEYHGGDLIENLLREFDPDLSFTAVRATRGKFIRAEPVAALYEKGKVSHAGMFRDLEDELTGYNPLTSVKSPDRLDALVWTLTELARPVSRLVTV